MRDGLKSKLLPTAIASALAIAAGGWVGQASAATVIDQLFLGEKNKISDNDGENEINVAGGTLGTIDKGDRFRGVLTFNTTADQTGGGGASNIGGVPVATSNELSGLFDVTVIDIKASVLGIGFDIFFGPTAGFAATVDTLAGLAAGTTHTGTMLALFEDAVPDFLDVSPGVSGWATVVGCEAIATDGSIFATVGFNTGAAADADNLWVTAGAVLSLAAFSLTSGSILSSSNIHAQVLDNYRPINYGLVDATFGAGLFPALGKDGLAQINASVSLKGSLGTASPYLIQSNTDVFILPTVVPEPGTLALLGLGLLAGGVGLRRKVAVA